MSLQPGARLGPYEILALVGAGGMGEVYKARDIRLDRTVAIKILPDSLAADADRRARFTREARILSGLNHPHVCTVYDVGEAALQGPEPRDPAAAIASYLVMEFLDGETLADRLRRGALPLTQALDCASQIAEGLAAAHKQGIIHRDLKPANVFLTRTGATRRDSPQVKLLDFGLAKLRDSGIPPPASGMTSAPTDHAPLTGHGTILGTVPYMAPEQLEGKPADARTDLFAFGAIVYEVVTGRRAFEGSSDASVIAAIMEREPPPLAERQPLTPPALERLVRRCLAKHPDDRWESAHDVADELRWISSPAATTAAAQPKIHRLRRSAIGVAAAVILLGAAAGGVWLWRSKPGTPPAAGAGPSAADAGQRKIMLAVLPVDNLSGDASQEYFSDGLTEEMIAQLGRLRPGRLGVIARTSAMRYKRTTKPIDEIGRELGVDYILESSLRREGSRARITAQLIQVRDQTHLWAETYDRGTDQILAVESDVASRVADALAVELLPEERSALANAPSVNPEAHDLYLKGRYHWFRRTARDLLEATASFRAAVDADPGYALAYAGLADTYALYSFYFMASAKESFPQARAAAAKALTLDQTLVEARTTGAFIALNFDWDWATAESELRQILERRPDYVIARQWYAEYLTYTGRTDAAVAEIKKLQATDPLSPLFKALESYVFYHGQRFDEAIEAAEGALNLDPGFGLAHTYLSRALLEKGENAKALEHLRQSGGVWAGGAAADLAYLYARSGQQRESIRLLDQLLKDPATQHFAVRVAMIYAALGRDDDSMSWLEKAYQNREPWMVRLKTAPWFAPLRTDSRFQALVRRMKFPQS